MICELRGLTIEYVKKANVKASLEERRQIRVDPFKQGFEHMNMDINLSAVRLCFQVNSKRFSLIYASQQTVFINWST